MKLSPNFHINEFERRAVIPLQYVPIFKRLCNELLEPIRLYMGAPLIITSGYRTKIYNLEVGGAATSEHVATQHWCACDFTVEDGDMRGCFDWVRMHRSLPFHQVIFEHTHGNKREIIHISINELRAGERKAMEGATFNRSAFMYHETSTFAPERV